MLVNYIGFKVFEMCDIYVFVIVLNVYVGCLMIVFLCYMYCKVWNVLFWVFMLVVFGVFYLMGIFWVVV